MYTLKKEFMIVVMNPQVAEQEHSQLVNIQIPFDKFTIVDSNQKKVEFDHFKYQIPTEHHPMVEPVMSHVSLPVKFNAGQLYQHFFVKKDGSGIMSSHAQLNQRHSQNQMDTTSSMEQNFELIFSTEA